MISFKNNCLILIIIVLVFPVVLFGIQHSHQHQHQQHRKDRHQDRGYWQMPNRILDEINVKEGMMVADVGAGDGYFTFFLSERVGKMGKVYASDIDDHALQVIRDRCKEEGISNISVVHGKEDDPLLPEKVFDVVLMVNTIHLVKKPTVLLEHIARSLKTNGYLVIIQWSAEKMGTEFKKWDPDDRERYTLRTNLGRIYDAGFEVVQLKDFLPMQIIFVCQPKASQ